MEDQEMHIALGDYPYGKLMKLFVEMDYAGWSLLEARTNPTDKIAAMIEHINQKRHKHVLTLPRFN